MYYTKTLLKYFPDIVDTKRPQNSNGRQSAASVSNASLAKPWISLGAPTNFTELLRAPLAGALSGRELTCVGTRRKGLVSWS